MISMYDILHRKRLGKALSEEEIRFFIKGVTAGTIPDYQTSALCMAICLQGMNSQETACLTEAMMRSGETLDLSRYGNHTVDKHSTGGVGDKTTLIVAPTVAALGCKVAKMSGRGLGHTGGTIDKLESIPGYRTVLSEKEFDDLLTRVGVGVIEQSANLAPADKKLYALRDLTATVDSLPLIASSIMSKKLAAGAHSIVLDVKTGSGAFMKSPSQAEALAQTMISVGQANGREVHALITNMDQPLGNAIGNALEVQEALRILTGEQTTGDLYDLSVALSAYMLSASMQISLEDATAQVRLVLSNGRAYEKMQEWIEAQGGDVTYLHHPERLLSGVQTTEIVSEREGYLTHMDAEQIGLAAMRLGAGRQYKEDIIDPKAGIVLGVKLGEAVHVGQTIAWLYSSNSERMIEASKLFQSALCYGDDYKEKLPLILSTL